MIEIEFEEPAETICKCCGSPAVLLVRFLKDDGFTYAAYYAAFAKAHEERRVHGILGLGEWENDDHDDFDPEYGIAFPFQIWINENNYDYGLSHAEDSPWSHTTCMGKILDPEEALAHERIKDFYHIMDHHILIDDQEILKYLNG